MKKGDVVSKDLEVEKGTIVIRGCSTQESAVQSANQLTIEKYGRSMETEILPDELNEGKIKAVILNAFTISIEATVSWVVEDTIALQLKDGSPRIIEENEIGEWKVVRESAPTYQSSVAEMTEEQLRESIETLRTTRATAPKIRKASTRVPTVDKNDPLALLLDTMPQEKKLALMRKLGMTD